MHAKTDLSTHEFEMTVLRLFLDVKDIRWTEYPSND